MLKTPRFLGMKDTEVVKDGKKVKMDIPVISGVYIFFNDEGEIIYVGKAAEQSLRQRVGKQFNTHRGFIFGYFNEQILNASEKDVRMRTGSKYVLCVPLLGDKNELDNVETDLIALFNNPPGNSDKRGTYKKLSLYSEPLAQQIRDEISKTIDSDTKKAH